MSKQKRVSHPLYSLLPADVEGFDSLAELALDLRWSWDHAADEVYGGEPERQEMGCVGELGGELGGCVYSAAVPAARPPADYTARVIPHCDGVAIPLEDARILWQQ